ncbi:MAG: ligase-associated DNA damage response exonuclease [Paracoccus sp. (in: a-proteobacteria)]
MRADSVLFPTKAGLYCPAGDFHIDPSRPVARALITHGHGDHARAGHGAVLATAQTLAIMAQRLGPGFAREVQAADGPLRIGGVTVGFHPAGHVLGSAQIAVTPDGGPKIVVSGDYARQPNPTCAPFQPVACDIFVTEATFGLPVFRFPDPLAEIARLLRSIQDFPERPHLVAAYALGKAQHVIALARQAGYDRPIAIHASLQPLCDLYAGAGVALGPLTQATDQAQLVIAPPNILSGPWLGRFRDPVIGMASGWMAVRARARGTELPLVISDHADWPGLTATLRELSPAEVWITHGAEGGLLRWCEMQGLPARPLRLVGPAEVAP